MTASACLQRPHGRATSTLLVVLAMAASLLVGPVPAHAVDTDSSPDEFTILDDLVLFAAGDGLHGRELWATDLTDTWLVKDIWPGPDGSDPSSLTAVGDLVYFVANDGTHGEEVWVTDGTAAGTVLLDDTWPGSSGMAQGRFAPVGNDGDVVFRSGNDTVGQELYVHDRSAGTTTLIQDLNPGPANSNPSSLTALSDGRVILSATAASSNSEPWITDGTGLTSLGEIAAGAAGSLPSSFVELAPGVIVFDAWGTAGNEPWVTDGTIGGTMILKDINPGGNSSLPGEMVIFDGQGWFGANNGVTGAELWTTDGTPGGTVLVHDVNPGPDGSDPQSLFAYDGDLYFQAQTDAAGDELWRTDGTPGGLAMAVDLRPGSDDSWPEPQFVLDGAMILTAATDGPDGYTGIELFTSDGTTAGTDLIHESLPGSQSSFGDRFVGIVHDGTILFGATDGHGYELWTSDGTPGGSSLLEDIRLGIGPREMVIAGDRAFFTAEDPEHGLEVWMSESTPGTARVIDIVPGPDSSNAYVIGTLGDRAILNTYGDVAEQAWITDGTPAGTTALTELGDESSGIEWIAPGLQVGDRYVFPVGTAEQGQELWVTDGTPAGTNLLKDIEPGPDSSNPWELTAHQGRVWFQAETSTHGNEVWVTDGTTAGTVRVTDINPGSGSADPAGLVSSGDWLWFAADDGTNGTELWRLDDGSTVENLADLAPGSDSSHPDKITAVGDRVFFTARVDVNTELYVSDGTESGTTLVKDIDPVSGSLPRDLTASGGRLFFTADDSTHGDELWVSNGTEAGTTMVKDLTPGAARTWFDEIVATSDGVLFTARDETGVRHAYRSDGTAAGTVPADLPGFDIQELRPGSLWYTAYEEGTGRGQVYRASSADSDDAVPLLYQSVLDRLSGPDRFATAAAVSADRFTSADTVVIARGDVYADALAGGPLAYELDAPILLTRTGSLPDVTRDEITRLGATQAVILGGGAAVSAAVEAALTDTTSVTSTTRHAGADRFETAGLVAAELPATTSAYVVEGANADVGRGWPDAVAVSSLASWTGTPILLVTQSRLPGATAQAMADLGLDDAVIVGGAAAVGDAVADAIEDAGVTVADRLSGDNRFLTSLAVAEASVDAGMDARQLWVATGRAFPDALVAGPAAADANAPLLLVHGTSMTATSDSADWFDAHGSYGRVVLLGGEAAISAAVANVIRTLAGIPS